MALRHNRMVWGWGAAGRKQQEGCLFMSKETRALAVGTSKKNKLIPCYEGNHWIAQRTVRS